MKPVQAFTSARWEDSGPNLQAGAGITAWMSAALLWLGRHGNHVGPNSMPLSIASIALIFGERALAVRVSNRFAP